MMKIWGVCLFRGAASRLPELVLAINEISVCVCVHLYDRDCV